MTSPEPRALDKMKETVAALPVEYGTRSDTLKVTPMTLVKTMAGRVPFVVKSRTTPEGEKVAAAIFICAGCALIGLMML